MSEPLSLDRDVVRILADRVSGATSTDELLALLEQMVSNCSEIIATILADQGSARPQPFNHLSPNNDII